MDPIVVGEKVISCQGAVITLRRYLKGWWPELGQLHWGLSGPETVVEVTKIQTLHFFSVVSGRVYEAA